MNATDLMATAARSTWGQLTFDQREELALAMYRRHCEAAGEPADRFQKVREWWLQTAKGRHQRARVVLIQRQPWIKRPPPKSHLRGR